jgi:hypothetical protein
MTKLDLKTLYRLIQYGDKWRDKFGPVKILACVDNYVMVRRPRAAPFVVSIRKFAQDFTRLTNEDNR